MSGEQIGSACLALAGHFGGHGIGAVTGLRALQVVALAVMREAFGIFTAILVGLAQCKGDVDPVHEGEIGPRRLIAHRDHFRVGEAIGLEIGERVVRIAMVRLRSEGGAIAFDRVRLLAHRLERVAPAGQRGGIVGQLFQHPVEQFEGAIIISGLQALDREMRLEQRIGRIASVKRLCLLARTLELLPAAQRVDIV